MDNRPIGIYDSGIGGLTLWRAVRDLMPNESLIYLGDGANCPYGMRARAEIEHFADTALSQLVEAGCKIVIVACNTATAAAIDFLRSKYCDINIVGMEPAVKPACLQTRSGVVGVLATQRSLEGDLFQHTAAKYSDRVRIIASYGEGFVELVEADLEASDMAEQVVRRVVDPMVEAGVDQIVLGCTHYPFLIPIIERVAPNVNIIDPSPAVAKRTRQLLEEHNLIAAYDNDPQYRFLTFSNESYRCRLEAKSRLL